MENGIIIFDGVCNFCNSSVNFIMERDTHNYFKFTANQHEAGKKILSDNGVNVEDVSTVFLYKNGKLYKKSTAALHIARALRFPWFLFYAFILIPSPIRDIVYDFIARNRYKWFGKKETCRMPSPAERTKFLG